MDFGTRWPKDVYDLKPKEKKEMNEVNNIIELDLKGTPGTPIDIASALIRYVEDDWKRKPLSLEKFEFIDNYIENDLECICDIIAAELRRMRGKKMAARPIGY